MVDNKLLMQTPLYRIGKGYGITQKGIVVIALPQMNMMHIVAPRGSIFMVVMFGHECPLFCTRNTDTSGISIL
ncbi:hypothetical protein SAMN05660420_01675 [Desulfuromusa kysingii]|uniref:Uncharacterized protein n=1 Tax=Desulfuromusa kysingii TaxID=37625 RepID=A0A1H3ZU00_9BACT|nr:hypothetical protein SAMN05660420_01675 [Desulfuromusa kysingii]